MAIQAYGTEIWIGDSDPTSETFYEIKGVGDIDGPGMSMEDIETTAHDTGLAYLTREPTLIDPGEMSFTIQYDPQHNTHRDSAAPGLGYYFANRSVFKVRLTVPDPSLSTREMSVFVANFGESYPVKGLVLKDVTLRFSSPPVASVRPS